MASRLFNAASAANNERDTCETGTCNTDTCNTSAVQIFVKDVTSGKSRSVVVDLVATAADAKATICYALSVPPGDILLRFRGKLLNDDRTLCESGIMKGDTLNAVALLRGGAYNTSAKNRERVWRQFSSKPIRMFHGTSKQAAAQIMHEGFTPSTNGMLGPGVYLSRDVSKAAQYGPGQHGPNGCILVVLVKCGWVHAISDPNQRNSSWQNSTRFNTAWVRPGVQPSGEEDCVKNPFRCKVIQLIS